MTMFGDFSRYTTIIPEEHQPALQRNLTKIPDFSWLLSEPHPLLERLQGDLISEFPTVFLDDAATPRHHAEMVSPAAHPAGQDRRSRCGAQDRQRAVRDCWAGESAASLFAALGRNAGASSPGLAAV